VRVPVCNMMGTAIDGFDGAGFHVVDVADDFGSVLDLPTSYVIAGSEDGRQSDRRVDLAGAGGSVVILQPVKSFHGRTLGVAFHPTSLEHFEVGGGRLRPLRRHPAQRLEGQRDGKKN